MTLPTVYTLTKPPSLSGCFRNARGPGRAKTPRYKAWLKTAGNEITAQGKVRFTDKVRLTMAVPYRANADLSNYWKATEDLLVAMQVIRDDSMKYVVEQRAVISTGPFSITVEAA